MAGVIPLIFASSLLSLPGIIAQLNTPNNGSPPPEWVSWINTYLVRGDYPLYITLYFFLIQMSHHVMTGATTSLRFLGL